jgi:hypothetical protein
VPDVGQFHFGIPIPWPHVSREDAAAITSFIRDVIAAQPKAMEKYLAVAKNLLASLGIIKKAELPTDPGTLGHIFDPSKKGHVADTPENRDLVEGATGEDGVYLGKDKYGNDWHCKVLPDGRQVWVESRDGKIWDAGINDEQKPWNPNTGLKNPNPPDKESK